MPCDFPEHHGSGGGGWAGPIAAIFAAMVAAALIGPWLHWILLAVACIIIGAVVTGILVVRTRLPQHQRLQHLIEHGYTPYLQPQQPHQLPLRQPYQLPVQQQQPAVQQDGGQHLHFHGMTPAEIADAMRQLRGGQ
jgi:hypothetical protein